MSLKKMLNTELRVVLVQSIWDYRYEPEGRETSGGSYSDGAMAPELSEGSEKMNKTEA